MKHNSFGIFPTHSFHRLCRLNSKQTTRQPEIEAISHGGNETCHHEECDHAMPNLFGIQIQRHKEREQSAALNETDNFTQVETNNQNSKYDTTIQNILPASVGHRRPLFEIASYLITS